MEFYEGIIIFWWKVSVIKIHKVSVSMNKVQGALPLQQCLSFSLSLSFLKKFWVPLFIFFVFKLYESTQKKSLSKTSGCLPDSAFFKAIKLGI